MNNFYNSFKKFITNRLTIVSIITIFLFSVLVIKLFTLQILNGDFYNKKVKTTTVQDIIIPAPRGSIYDRYGRPLATNKSSFTINIDASINIENQNQVLLNLINMLEKNNEDIVDNFPISKEKPYVFTLNGSEKQEKRWKNDMNLDEKLNAEECFSKLREKFDVDKNLSDDDARKILSLRCELYSKRYSKYIPVTVAYDIKTETISAIEEEKSAFPGIYIDVEALRHYPEGKYFAHTLGYIRTITEAELNYYRQFSDNYNINTIVGKDGIEKAFELELNGKNGIKYVEVDSVGRRINTIDSQTVEPIPGNKVFLTVDSRLQEAAYNTLENTLRKTIINRLTGKNSRFRYSVKQVLMSMVNSNNISIENIMKSEGNSVESDVKNHILSIDKTAAENTDLAKQILINAIDKGNISSIQLILILDEQGTVKFDEEYKLRIKRGTISALQVLLDKLNTNEITPAMTAMDPCTGSVVINDIHTGDILTAVSYPSYDNNEFVNNFNNEYYLKLQSDQVTTPLVNRPFTEPRAPGSTFKMITSTAGLEEGLITPNSIIYDKGTFTEAGFPYARCWIGSGKGSHGGVNVSHALEVSCNYFFYDLSFKMGNSKRGTTLKGISTLNKYMEYFGLNDPTGVEIYELYDSMSNYPSKISSPDYKRYIYGMRNPDASESTLKWYDGDTIRTAIGQSFNNYTAATMTKYIATLANGGTRYTTHYLNKVVSYDGKTINEYTPNVETKINISSNNLKAIHYGMYLVTSGDRGTLRNIFSGFPIPVAAKSGTAQESSNRSDHTLFVGFAPYDEPQIAISVLIPFGDDTSTSPAPNIAKEIIGYYTGLEKTPETKHINTLTE